MTWLLRTMETSGDLPLAARSSIPHPACRAITTWERMTLHPDCALGGGNVSVYERSELLCSATS